MDIKQFEQAYHDHACSKTSLPKEYVPRTKFSEKSANDLTKLIVEFINFNGGFARRVSVEGRVIEGKKFVNSMGETRILPSKRIKSSMVLGTADISSIMKSKKGTTIAWEIEIKMNDKQSEHQKTYQSKVENAGGVYNIVRNFEQFYNKYCELINN